LIASILLSLSFYQREATLRRLIVIHVGRRRAHELLLRASGPVVGRRSRRNMLLRMALPAGILVSTIITLLAQFGPRVATHLPRPLRLTELTVDVAVRRTHHIVVLVARVDVGSRLFARWRLDVRVRDW
jgi:hypothetical protein